MSLAPPLREQAEATYFSLRATLAVLAFVFPLLLWAGGNMGEPKIHLRESMSAYYWAAPGQECPCGKDVAGHCPKKDEISTTVIESPAQSRTLLAGTLRNYFVGFLFAVGFILFVYKGYSQKENVALNFAGAMAVGVALFPMPWDCDKHPFTIHGACAILFFLSIAYVSAFRSEDTLDLLRKIDSVSAGHYRTGYRILASAMVLSPAFAFVFSWSTGQKSSFTYWAEFCGIYAFSIYWVVKMTEISKIRSKKAAFEPEKSFNLQQPESSIVSSFERDPL
jgi:hypothetical protein